MAWVTPKVEVSFTTNPLDTPVWSDITAYVETIDINRGRSSELSTFSAGTCTVVLRNDDRRFDPNHATSPYGVANLVPKKQIRVTANLGSGDVALYTGFVNGWPLTIDNMAKRVWCELSATDAFEFLSSTPMPASPYTAVALSRQPTGMYRLDDDLTIPAGEYGYLKDQSRNSASVPAYGLTWVDFPGDYPSDIDRAAYFAGNSVVYLPDNLITPTAYTVGFWLKADVLIISDPMVIVQMGSGMRIGIDRTASANQGKMFVEHHGSSSPKVFTTASVVDSVWHHWLVTFDGVAITIYRDGAFVSTLSTVGFTMAEISSERYLGRQQVIAGAPSWPGLGLTGAALHSVVFLDHKVLVAEDFYEAMLGFDQQQAYLRIRALLAAGGWPNLLTSVPNSQSEMQPTPEMSGTLLDALHKVTESEAGALYVKADGTIRFEGRHTRHRNPSLSDVQATFGDSGSELRYLEGNPSQDTANLHNSVVVSRKGGGQVVVEDQDSIDKYWRRGSGISKTDLLLTNDLEMQAYAEWLLYRYRTPVSRVEDVTIDARTSAAVLEQCVTRELQDRIYFRRKVNNVGAVVTYDGLIEGIKHSISLRQRTWVTTFNLAPVELAEMFQFDHPTRNQLGRYALGY